jgi:DNA-binding response OmpR family regulator
MAREAVTGMLFGRKKRRISRLLIVEDEPLVAFDTEHFLREAEFEIVATVDRVADALAVLRRPEDVDLVLVDVRLSDGSGIDVARAAYGAGVPAMFVTGQSPAGGQAVATGCLAKPYSQRDLLGAIDAIEAVIEGKTPKRLPPGFTLFPTTR